MAYTSNLSDNTINAIGPDIKAFTSLWTSLHVTNGRKNITKTIGRLLNMYRPENGIQAYEKLLKMLFSVLKDFDENGLRSLLSMVPVPKGSSEETIRDVFFKTTGFIRNDTPSFHQNYLLPSSVTNMNNEIKKGNDRENLVNQSVRDNNSIEPKSSNATVIVSCSDYLQMLPEDYYSFRGFLSTEIFSHNQNIQKHNLEQYFIPESHYESTANLSLSGYKMNRYQDPYCFQNRNIRQTSSCYQDTLMKTMGSKYRQIPAEHCSLNMHYLNSPYQIISRSQEIQSKDKHTITRGSLMNLSQTVVSSDSYVIQEEQKKTNDVVNARTYLDLNEHSNELSEKSEEKSDEIDRKKYQDRIPDEVFQMNMDHFYDYIPLSIEECIIKDLTVERDLSESIRKFLKRAQEDESSSVINDVSETENKSAYEISSENSYRKKDLQLHAQKLMEKSAFHNGKNIKNHEREINDDSYNFLHQSNLMSELAVYKRQYYDALLNIQRAKLVVENSLVLPPIEIQNEYNPYHPDDVQQHQWIFQQPQRLIVGPSYARRFAQPGYPAITNTSLRSRDWMSTHPATQVAQKMSSIHTSYDSHSIYANDELVSQLNICIPIETKLEAKKRKLENIVVKLKDNDMNSVQN